MSLGGSEGETGADDEDLSEEAGREEVRNLENNGRQTTRRKNLLRSPYSPPSNMSRSEEDFQDESSSHCLVVEEKSPPALSSSTPSSLPFFFCSPVIRAELAGTTEGSPALFFPRRLRPNASKHARMKGYPSIDISMCKALVRMRAYTWGRVCVYELFTSLTGDPYAEEGKVESEVDRHVQNRIELDGRDGSLSERIRRNAPIQFSVGVPVTSVHVSGVCTPEQDQGTPPVPPTDLTLSCLPFLSSLTVHAQWSKASTRLHANLWPRSPALLVRHSETAQGREGKKERQQRSQRPERRSRAHHTAKDSRREG